MKKFIICLFLFLLISSPVCFAGSYDTNDLNGTENKGGGGASSKDSWNPYWYFGNITGTRYIFRIYDRGTNKYIAVPQEYYINHVNSPVYSDDEVMYLGADKTSNGKYDIVKSAKR